MAFAVSAVVHLGFSLPESRMVLSSFRRPMGTCFGYPKLQKMTVPRSAKLKLVNCSIYGNDSSTKFNKLEPLSFWTSMLEDVIWNLRSLAAFLIEQPSQLKHIEWPTFQSTLKTAVFTLVLVAVFIVALSSVDSALSYTLALLLRRTG